jgi:hypothetical protein
MSDRYEFSDLVQQIHELRAELVRVENDTRKLLEDWLYLIEATPHDRADVEFYQGFEDALIDSTRAFLAGLSKETTPMRPETKETNQ